MLTALQFDFNFPSTLTFLERFLRVANLQQDQEIVQLADSLL